MLASSGACVILEDEAANDMVLDLISKQCWNIRKLELHGILIHISNDKLCEFMRLQNQNQKICDVQVFRIEVGFSFNLIMTF